jgi:CRP-like cAMP-binding protein
MQGQGHVLMQYSDDFQIFKSISLFNGLNDQQIEEIFSISQPLTLQKGSYLAKEGSKATDLYIVLEGSLEIIKSGIKHERLHQIAEAGSGDVIGEIAFLNKGYRSASVQAKSDVRLREIPFHSLELLLRQDPRMYHIYFEIAKNESQMIEKSNFTIISQLEEKLDYIKLREFTSVFLIYLITFLCIFIFVSNALKTDKHDYISIPWILSATAIVLIFVKQTSFPLKSLGMTLDNWKLSVFEGVIYSIPMLIVILIAKYVLLNYTDMYDQLPLFQLNHKAQSAQPIGLTLWLAWIGLYCLLVPMQEFIARECFQGSLEMILLGKSRRWMSILISNLLFSVAHILISVYFALIVFVPGIFLGWLYVTLY